jgi:hypothetical protein
MLQAVDLAQLELDLRSNPVVIVEIFDALWAGLEARVRERIGARLRTASVFMTAVDPRSIADPLEAGAFIEREVAAILTRRQQDSPADIAKRAKSSVKEISDALDQTAAIPYDRIFHSAPEGPDGEDDWTRSTKPSGQAAAVLAEFATFVRETEASANR